MNPSLTAVGLSTLAFKAYLIPDSESTHTPYIKMREGAPGTKIAWSLEGELVVARKGHRSQGTPASHEQGRLVAGICSELCGELSLQNSAGMFKHQYCSSRVVKLRAAPLMRADVVRLPLGSTSKGRPPNVSRHGTAQYCGTHTVQARLRSTYHAFTRATSVQTSSAHTEASGHRAALRNRAASVIEARGLRHHTSRAGL
jgi:hypothetical protein